MHQRRVLNVLGVPWLAVPETRYTWKREELAKSVAALLAFTIENLKKKNERVWKSRKALKWWWSYGGKGPITNLQIIFVPKEIIDKYSNIL